MRPLTAEDRRKSRTHNLITDYERRAIREKHRKSRNLTQQQLAAWASREFLRPISQSTISDSLHAKYASLDLANRGAYAGLSSQLKRHVNPASQHCAGCKEVLTSCICQAESVTPASETKVYMSKPGLAPTFVDMELYRDCPENARYSSASSAWCPPRQVNPSAVWFPQLLDVVTTSIPSHRGCTTPTDALARWLSLLPSRLGRTQVLDEALRSFIIFHVGLNHNDRTTIQKSRYRYGIALSALQAAIGNPNAPLTSDTVMAVMLMSLFESCINTESDGWHNHISGAALMMMQMDLSAFSDELGILFLRAFRRELSWTVHETRDYRIISSPQFKRAVRDVDVPGYIEQDCCQYDIFIRKVYRSGIKFIAIHKGLMSAQSPQDFSACIRAMLALKSEYQERINTMRMVIPPIKVPSEGNDHIFPVIYDYENLCHAFAHVLSWNLLLGMNAYLTHLQPGVSYQDEMQQLTEDLCKSVDFLAGAGFLAAATHRPEIFSLLTFLKMTSPEKYKWLCRRLEGWVHISAERDERR